MSNDKPPKYKAVAMAKNLKDTLAQRRPRRWQPALVTAAFALVLILVVSYLIWYPRQPPTSLHVIALDGVFAVDETPRVQAQLLAPLAEQGTRRMRGERVVFVEQRLPGEKPRESVATSDAGGRAAIEWPITPPLAEFQARYVVPPGSIDRGRLFAWPRATPLLLVDADETLIGDVVDVGAVASLTKAHEDGWRIVYLALAGTNGYDFKKARDWIVMQPKLPKGPVLGRAQYPNEEDSAPVRREALKSLQERFKGAHVAVVKNAAAAKIGGELGIRAIQIDGATKWTDVAAQLKK